MFKKILAAHTNTSYPINVRQIVWKLGWNVHHYNSSKHPSTSWRHPDVHQRGPPRDFLTILTELCIWGRAFPTFLQTSPFIILWSLSSAQETPIFFWPKQVLRHPKTCSMKLQWPDSGYKRWGEWRVAQPLNNFSKWLAVIFVSSIHELLLVIPIIFRLVVGRASRCLCSTKVTCWLEHQPKTPLHPLLKGLGITADEFSERRPRRLGRSRKIYWTFRLKDCGAKNIWVTMQPGAIGFISKHRTLQSSAQHSLSIQYQHSLSMGIARLSTQLMWSFGPFSFE